MSKVFIAVPTFESIYPDTFKSIYGLDKAGQWCVFDFVRGYDCATARNNIAKQSKFEEADYVLMVDSDVVLPSDALKNMLEDPKDVVLGWYAHRDGVYDGRSSICKLGEPLNYTWQASCNELNELASKGINRIQVHGGGMGCALIKTDVFDRIKFPYFSWVNYNDGSVLGEDLFFCEQLKNVGINIYADTRVGCGHIFRTIQEAV